MQNIGCWLGQRIILGRTAVMAKVRDAIHIVFTYGLHKPFKRLCDNAHFVNFSQLKTFQILGGLSGLFFELENPTVKVKALLCWPTPYISRVTRWNGQNIGIHGGSKKKPKKQKRPEPSCWSKKQYQDKWHPDHASIGTRDKELKIGTVPILSGCLVTLYISVNGIALL